MLDGISGNDEHTNPIGKKSCGQHAEWIVYVVHGYGVPHGMQELMWEDEIQESENNLNDSNDHEKNLEFHGDAF